VRTKVVEKIVKVKGAPAYMVSFGDMMTLILCFFILLVALSKERNYGLMAKGLGSFVVALKSHGMPGILSSGEKQKIFSQVRRRFNLPPEPDPHRRTDHELASSSEMLRAEAVEALKPRREIRQPQLGRFEAGSAELTPQARRYIDLQADSLRPAYGQVLVLEGHATPSERGETLALAFARARAVEEYLAEEHRFDPERMEARAWWGELTEEIRQSEVDVVHARLVMPSREKD